jgi:hypothetical protein
MTLNKKDLIACLVWLGIFIVFFLYTYQKWGSAVIDCGRDPYVASRILAGDNLYTDVYYVYGPLAPLALAVMFLIYGVHLNTAYLLGVFLALCSLMLLYLVARTILEPFWAALTTIICIVMFCFNHFIFNYIFPYAYSAMFGLLFSLLMVLFLLFFIKEKHPRFLVLAGFVTGLAIVTKLEFAFALTTLYVGFMISAGLLKFHLDHRVILKSFLAIVSPAIVVVLVTFMFNGVSGMAEYIKYSEFSHMSEATQFFIKTTFGGKTFIKGLQAFPRHLGYIFVMFLFSALITFVVFKIELEKFLYYIITALTVGIFVIIYKFSPPLIIKLDYFRLYMGLFVPPILTGVLLYFAVHFFYRKKQFSFEQLTIVLIAVYTILIILRHYLNYNITGYAVYYAPLSLVIIVYFFRTLPRWLASIKPSLIKIMPYWYAFCLVFGLVMINNYKYAQYFVQKVPVSTSRGTIYTTQAIGEPLSQLVYYIEKYTKKTDTIVLFPEEVLIYFLTERKSSSKFYDYLPMRLPERSMEEQFARDLEKKPPALIAVSNRSVYEYSFRAWGLDYNLYLADWLQKNYQQCVTLGSYQTETYFRILYGLKIYQKTCPVPGSV